MPARRYFAGVPNPGSGYHLRIVDRDYWDANGQLELGVLALGDLPDGVEEVGNGFFSPSREWAVIRQAMEDAGYEESPALGDWVPPQQDVPREVERNPGRLVVEE